MKPSKNKAAKLPRSKIPFPPTKVFKDKKKEESKTACRKSRA